MEQGCHLSLNGTDLPESLLISSMKGMNYQMTTIDHDKGHASAAINITISGYKVDKCHKQVVNGCS